MTKLSDNPDVREVQQANIAACRHLQRGTLHRTIGAGGGRIGCRTESYYGCLLCKLDLEDKRLVYLFFHNPADAVIKDEAAFEAWLDRELGIER